MYPKRLSIIIFNLIFVFNCNAQICNCEKSVDSLIYKIENNYIDGIKLANQKSYIKFKNKINSKKKSIKSNTDCLKLISEIRDIAKDKHIRVTLDHKNENDYKIEVIDSAQINLYNSVKFIKPIEGFWQTSTGDRFLIIKESDKTNRFFAYHIDSVSKKFTKGARRVVFQKISSKKYKAFYLNSKLVETYRDAVLQESNNILNFEGVKWVRIGIENINNNPTSSPAQQFTSIEFLPNETTVLTLKSFSNSKAEIDSVLLSNKSKLSSTKHLIVKVDENGGGSVLHYKNLMPYIYTQPYIIEAAKWRASNENIKTIEQSLLQLKQTDTIVYNDYADLLSKMKNSKDGYVNEPDVTRVFDSVFYCPKIVSILMGGRTASAAELFLLAAMQSTKVTIFGKENSYGACDNLDAYNASLGNNLFVSIPLSKRIPTYYHNLIDNVGIPPQVKIPINANPVEFIINYQKRKFKIK